MTKRKIIWTAALVIAVIGIAIAAVLAIGNLNGGELEEHNTELPGKELYVEADKTKPEIASTDSSPEVEKSVAVNDSENVPVSTGIAEPNAVEASSADESSVYDPPYEKTPAPDNSPEAQLAKLKERLASSNAEAIRINQQKQALEAEKAELLASVGGDEAKLDSTQSAELKRIDAALEEIWLNYSLLTENPNFYEYEAYFYRTVNNNMAEAKRTMEISEKDSYDYAHAAELVDMFEKMLETYECGEDLDTVFLYQFERLAEMN